jgi:hypothetical protein
MIGNFTMTARVMRYAIVYYQADIIKKNMFMTKSEFVCTGLVNEFKLSTELF